MRPTEDEIKRYYLVQAVFLLLQQIGLVSEDYGAIGRAEWRSKAPGLLRKGSLAPSPHLSEADPGGVFTKIQGCGLYVNTAGKTISYDGFWRSFQNLVSNG